MKRLILTLAAVTALAASPLAADFAFAKDKGGRGEDGGGRGQGRGPGRGGGDDGPRWERRGPPEGRGYERRRQYDGPPPEFRGPPRAVRPGGWLPPEYRGAPVYDYPRHRLRPPPAGYAWRRMGDAFVLVDRDGRVFDVIPD